MAELFFIKRFVLEKMIPYTVLFISIGYIIFECICPKQIKEYFYEYSDKLYFKYIIRPFKRIQNSYVFLTKSLKLNITKTTTKIKTKKEFKQNKKNQKQKEKDIKKNEKSKLKLNKKIARVNKKIDKKNTKIAKKRSRKKKIAMVLIKVFKLR